MPVCLMELCRHNLSLHEKMFDSNANLTHRNSRKKLFKFDVSISLQKTEDFLMNLKRKLSQLEGIRILPHASSHADDVGDTTDLLICCFGHAADENLHLNIVANFHFENDFSPQKLEERIHYLQNSLNSLVFNLIIERRGDYHSQ